MGKAVLISIKPKWCNLIASGKKTIEVRKTRPTIEPPFKVYIYQTLPEYGKFFGGKDGKVIGEALCATIMHYGYPSCYSQTEAAGFLIRYACLNSDEVWKYGRGKSLYGWLLRNIRIYDNPKNLSDFKPWNRKPEESPCSHLGLAIPECKTCHWCKVERPPQSYMYVEELEE